MSDIHHTVTPAGEAELPHRGMPPLWISYKELVEIRTQLASMQATLLAALALQGTVSKIDERLGKVEVALGMRRGEKRTWNIIMTAMGSLVVGLLGGGALIEYILPKLWGGTP